MKKAVIVNDVRAIPLLTSLQVADSANPDDRAILITSARTLHARDYGGNLYPRIYNSLKIRYLQQFHGLILVPEDPRTTLSPKEELGVLSSLCSVTQDTFASREKYPELYAEFESLAKGGLEINAYLQRERPDMVYVFNGRTASQYPTVAMCRASGIPVRYFEYAASRADGFTLFEFPPHYGYRVGQKLLEHFLALPPDDPTISERARRYRTAKLAGPYVSSYRREAKDAYDVVAFLGSDFEYTNLDQEICGVQSVGNLGLCRAVYEKYGASSRIAVRAHPNQRNDVSAAAVLAPVIDFCAAHGITFFGPESGISSYALIREAKVVAIDCSTIGVDAILLGKPVDVFGQNDLAAILDAFPSERKADLPYLQNAVATMMATADDPFFHRFDVGRRRAARILVQLDRVAYHIQRIGRRARQLFERRTTRSERPPNAEHSRTI